MKYRKNLRVQSHRDFLFGTPRANPNLPDTLLTTTSTRGVGFINQVNKSKSPTSGFFFRFIDNWKSKLVIITRLLLSTPIFFNTCETWSFFFEQPANMRPLNSFRLSYVFYAFLMNIVNRFQDRRRRQSNSWDTGLIPASIFKVVFEILAVHSASRWATWLFISHFCGTSRTIDLVWQSEGI